MPILLAKPFSVGQLDPDAGEGYPMVQLSSLIHNGITMGITLEYQYGVASGQWYERWERGAASPTMTVEVSGAEVVALWSQMPQEGESVGQAIRRVTYEYLLKNKVTEGTIVNNPPLPPVQEDVAQEPAPREPVGDDTAPAPAPTEDAPAETSEGTTADAPVEETSTVPEGDAQEPQAGSPS